MNKQELINKLGGMRLVFATPENNRINAMLDNVIDLVKKLDAPKKASMTLKQAQKLEQLVGELDYNLGDLLVNVGDEEEGLFARAYLDGYEIIKEPLYQIKIGGGYLVQHYADKFDFIIVKPAELKGWDPSGYRFTEARIKEFDPKFWPFAEKVADGK